MVGNVCPLRLPTPLTTVQAWCPQATKHSGCMDCMTGAGQRTHHHRHSSSSETECTGFAHLPSQRSSRVLLGEGFLVWPSAEDDGLNPLAPFRFVSLCFPWQLSDLVIYSPTLDRETKHTHKVKHTERQSDMLWRRYTHLFQNHAGRKS